MLLSWPTASDCASANAPLETRSEFVHSHAEISSCGRRPASGGMPQAGFQATLCLQGDAALVRPKSSIGRSAVSHHRNCGDAGAAARVSGWVDPRGRRTLRARRQDCRTVSPPVGDRLTSAWEVSRGLLAKIRQHGGSEATTGIGNPQAAAVDPRARRRSSPRKRFLCA